MDKHERPYKCLEPGCDRIEGFTYSGGLLRHRREVHKKYTPSKKPLFCPHTDCNRSSGPGFSRLENLKEHLRRRHVTEGQSADQLAEQVKEEATGESPARKRKRLSDRTDTTGYDDSEDSGDLREEVKRLRKENEEKDRRLGELEATVKSLVQQQQQRQR